MWVWYESSACLLPGTRHANIGTSNTLARFYLIQCGSQGHEVKQSTLTQMELHMILNHLLYQFHLFLSAKQHTAMRIVNGILTGSNVVFY